MYELPPDDRGNATTPAPEPASLDAIFDALADSRRRYVLHRLDESDPPLALPDLAAEIAARENGAPIDDLPAEVVEAVYVSLYHAHVPKLADLNVVEYDPDRELVSLAEEEERFGPVLALLTAGGQ